MNPRTKLTTLTYYNSISSATGVTTHNEISVEHTKLTSLLDLFKDEIAYQEITNHIKMESKFCSTKSCDKIQQEKSQMKNIKKKRFAQPEDFVNVKNITILWFLQNSYS